MPAQIIDGKALSSAIERDLQREVAEILPQLGRPPGLAVVLVGDNPASQVYVRSKSKRAQACGLTVTDVKLPADVTQSALEAALKKLNSDQNVDGILLQLPMPKGLDELSALSAIDPRKDADGLHPANQGLLLRGAPAPRPCTPFGVMKLIAQAQTQLGKIRPGERLQLSGMHAAVVGRSILVGKPQALLLLEENCTVTVCHSKTADLAAECCRADILIAAVGRPKLLTAEFIKPGAIVIDVGINQDDQGKLVGDVDFVGASEVASAITPVPGGVGPMTIAMLISNTVDIAKRSVGIGN